ncbi:MAG TPA: hypothetical protein PKD66_12435 [Azonexus sp.]|jgi:hypothetical protein|nr:hypothetical protein [Azonexus sp.]
MSDENSPKKSKSHVILWIAASLFIILAIAGMWAADYYFSPEMLSPISVPDAVGK